MLHFGEGPIQEIKWSGTLIAWANDLGVKIHDTTVHQRIAYIERPRSRQELLETPCLVSACRLLSRHHCASIGSGALLEAHNGQLPLLQRRMLGRCTGYKRLVTGLSGARAGVLFLRHPEQYCRACSLRHDKLQCRLFWEGDSLLHMGWANCVKVARVRPAPASPLAGAEAKRSLEIVASFQTDYLVAVRPFNAKLAPIRPTGMSKALILEAWDLEYVNKFKM